jgi:hypothetical protein
MTRTRLEQRADAALQSLSRDVQPERDLWPEIEARLDPPAPARRAWGWQVAAAVALVAISSLVTANLVRREQQPVAALAPVAERPSQVSAAPMPVRAAFGPSHALDAEYDAARQQLAAQLEQRLAAMPPSARMKLEANLAEMQRAAEEINAALARQPGDPLLQELLLNTYQDELGVLASVNQLTGTGGAIPAARKENLKL